MPIRIDWDRAESVFDTLVSDFRNKRFPYDMVEPPQIRENISPKIEWGSLEHGRFLFCSCYYMRGGIESDVAIKRLSSMFEDRPHLFDPDNFRDADMVPELLDALRANSLNFNSKQVACHWDLNFKKLGAHWGGDPAGFFRAANTYEDLCAIIIRRRRPGEPFGFQGFREKMVSMLIYFLLDAGIIDRLMFPVPVDFHVLRILVSNRLLYDPGVSDGSDLFGHELLASARELTQGYCMRRGADPIDLCNALWLLSRTLCHLHPGNRTIVGERNGRKTELAPQPVVWNSAQTLTYLNTCACCPIKGSCDYNVPSAPYYIRGQLIRRGGRDKPPLLFT